MHAEIFGKEQVGCTILAEQFHKRQRRDVLHRGQRSPRLPGNQRFWKWSECQALLLVLLENLGEDFGHVVDRVQHFLGHVDWLLSHQRHDNRVARAGVELDDFMA